MTLLVAPGDLAARREIAQRELAPLVRSLADDLAPLAGADPYVPDDKALLSRAGGRCPRDGAMLDFDPWSPHEHRCPRCGDSFRGELHDRFWIYWYQLWLAERAVNAATLAALDAGAGFAPIARTILDAYAVRYRNYPNRDNVLGPTRLFFSTYLESIWLLNVCIATDLLGLAGDTSIRQDVIERIVEPSAAIIAGYDEGASNRQVWNAAALCAAGRLMNDAQLTENAITGDHGLLYHLSNGLFADGSWYEGENYHLFAHRGLWYGVTLAERAGIELPRALARRFGDGFATPFLTALPDFTFPARRDSQFKVSLRQPRFAELAELGLARTGDPRLVAALAQLYASDTQYEAPSRSRTTADVERNGPPAALRRADLGWRSLLFALPELPPLDGAIAPSVLLPEQGFAVVRRESARVYVALDYGHHGGGHGHPDRLNLLLARGATRWLDDMGTGSYVDPSLHWFRSSLAHNAPFVDGRSQPPVNGTLVAFEDRGGAGWVSARAEVADGVDCERTLVVMPGYALDILAWHAGREVTIDLPLHVDASLENHALVEEQIAGSDGIEDGFRFVSDSARAPVHPGATVRLRATKAGESLSAFIDAAQPGELWRLVAPGPPDDGERPFWLLRSSSASGAWRTVWDWTGDVESVRSNDDAIHVQLRDGTTHVHSRTETGWHVDLLAAQAHSSIDLGGLAPEPAPRVPEHSLRSTRLESGQRAALSAQRRTSLGEPHYRRSEESWRDAGEPTAHVTLEPDDANDRLTITVEVPRSDLTFVAANTENPWDNEPADINGDGVQLYAAGSHGDLGVLLVPEGDGDRVRIRAIEGWGMAMPVSATWSRSAHGYTLTAIVGAIPHAIDVIVNEKPAGRTRRRGQLVLSGAAGEFVYLRGDRHDRDRLLPLVVE